LPDTIQFKYGNQIINRYAADGRKLGSEFFTLVTPLINPLDTGKVISQSYVYNTINQNGTVYVDNKEYKTLNGNSSLISLDRIFNSEGFSVYLNGTLTYNYYHKDHLGNNREVWRAAYVRAASTNIAAATIQQTQYYPSGLPWSEGMGASAQSRKFNGKEYDEMNGYDTYDYGARGYYPAMGRFITVDPLAEKYYSISPYAYCAGNPVNRIDPDGKDWYINGKTGGLYYNKNQSDQTITYKKQQYTKVGENDMMGKMGKTTEKNYNFKDSQKLANKNGFNINPVQEVQDKTTIKISDKESPTSINSDQYKVVVEKYAIYSQSENNKVLTSTEPLEVKKSFWENAASAAMAIGGAAKFETTGRNYYNYVSNSELKKTGMKADTYPWSAGDQVSVYGSWEEYSKATNGEGDLLNFKK